MGMTLDEAIKHAEEVACKKEREAKYIRSCEQEYDTKKWAISCEKYAKEHRQLAEWLKELKRYRETNTVSIDGILYQSAHPALKTIHGKTGEVVIGGFREVDNGN